MTLEQQKNGVSQYSECGPAYDVIRDNVVRCLRGAED